MHAASFTALLQAFFTGIDNAFYLWNPEPEPNDTAQTATESGENVKEVSTIPTLLLLYALPHDVSDVCIASTYQCPAV